LPFVALLDEELADVEGGVLVVVEEDVVESRR
jgi:hypothetical protein